MSTPERRDRVGIFRIRYPFASEPFLGEQARALKRYDSMFLIRSRVGEISAPSTAVSDHDFGHVKQLLFALRPRVSLFPNPGMLRKLALVHAHFGPDGTYGMDLARDLGVPLVVTFHGVDACAQRTLWGGNRPSVGWTRFMFLEKELMQQSARFIAVSEFIRRRLIALGYPEDKTVLHYIGVDTQKFVPGVDRSRERIILNVARHTAKKGIETLVRAFQRVSCKYPSVNLIQVGSGPLSRGIQALVDALGISERVRLLGDQPHHVVQSLMQRAELFALTSETAPGGDAEGLGLVLNEASASGCPVVATLHGGIAEAVEHGETGLLAKERDVVGIADQLDTLLGDPALRAEMGRKGRELVCDKFDLTKQTARLEEIYDEVRGGER